MNNRPEVFEYGGYGVNIKLTSASTSKDVVWVRGNSFVLVDDPEGDFLLGEQRVNLVSVNGIGEIRWDVREHDIKQAERYEDSGEEYSHTWDCFMHLAAYRHFGLKIA